MTAPPEDLIYYPDTEPGIRRHRHGRGFTYRAPDGTTIARGAERARIEALAVPPAYEQVWICPEPLGHLQATGRDARARKQYRYHEAWRAYRERTKFDGLAAFGAALPRLRRRVRRHLSEPAGSPELAIAAVIALLDRAALRPGSPEYAAENESFGAATLTGEHLSFEDGRAVLAFTAKGGQPVVTELRDRRLNRVLGRLDDLPGPTLASWVDDAGEGHAVRSEQLTARIVEWSGLESATPKTFRTWSGSAAAMGAAIAAEDLTIAAMAEAAAERLHNTPAIARKSYVHPAVVALADRPAAERTELAERAPRIDGLRRAEAALLALLDG